MTSLTYGLGSKHELLEQFFASATHDASAAMCRWTDGLITLTFDEVRDIAVEDAFVELNLNDQPSTMVVLTLEGEVGVRMILMFDNDDARRLAASLLGRRPTASPSGVPGEVGAAGDRQYPGLCLHERPGAPDRCRDGPVAALLHPGLRGQRAPTGPAAPAMVTDKVLICQTGFGREGKQLDWRVVFIPTAEMRKAMEETDW